MGEWGAQQGQQWVGAQQEGEWGEHSGDSGRNTVGEGKWGNTVGGNGGAQREKLEGSNL